MDYNQLKKISLILILIAFFINLILIVNSKPIKDEKIIVQKFNVYTVNKIARADISVLSKEDLNCTFIISYDTFEKRISKEISKGMNEFSLDIENMPSGKNKVFLNYECN